MDATEQQIIDNANKVANAAGQIASEAGCGEMVATMTAIGGAAGSVAPGPGTVIGSAVGALVGLGACAAKKLKKPKGIPSGNPQLQQHAALLWATQQLRKHGHTTPGDEREQVLHAAVKELMKRKWGADSSNIVWRGTAATVVGLAGGTAQQASEVAAAPNPKAAAQAFMRKAPPQTEDSPESDTDGMDASAIAKAATVVFAAIAAWKLGVF